MNRLQEILRKEFEPEKMLKDVAHSSCTTDETMVFDFDLIKDKLCSDLAIPQMKSVDALYFAKGDLILFIEMKRFDPTQPLSCSSFIELHLQPHEVHHKMNDSLVILLTIYGIHGNDPDFYKVLLNNNPNPKIKPILLVAMSNSQYINYLGISSPSRNISFTRRIESPITVFNCLNFGRYISSIS